MINYKEETTGDWQALLLEPNPMEKEHVSMTLTRGSQKRGERGASRARRGEARRRRQEEKRKKEK